MINTLNEMMFLRGVGVLFLDDLGFIVSKNSIADDIVKTTKSIWFSNKKLCVKDDNFNSYFPDIKCETLQSSTISEKNVYIQDDVHSQPIKLNTIPIIDNIELEQGIKTKWIVLITDTSEKPLFASKSMTSFYNLTPAEISLVTSIFDGLTLKEHAEKRGIRITTVRWTLENIFSKTYTNSQVLLKELANKFTN